MLLVAVAVHIPPAFADDAARIREVFAGYKAALVAGDGKAAAALVDRDTQRYFGELRQLSLSGTEPEVRGRDFIDRLLVVTIRHVLGRSGLETLELSDLIERAVAEGWIAPETVAQLEIGEISVNGDVATAEVVTAASLAALQAPAAQAPSAVAGLSYRFVREDGDWHFGFSALVQGLNQVIRQFTAELGTEEDTLIFVLVEGISGRKVLPEVWESPP